ncbi:helix-turn-helix domain-containing protein [Spirosoma sp. BT702]|uniref:histidine kinase n=1 Tax=Spirosoma profusum TaxID=2771354 RepID=A0A927GA65_9BACT|nr:two-component regulator propeller domain-containing protein [Spirosoma profusum]MBD2705173.1 helix-turn-helix domain-containing protein [Spirosoma profusum]
MKAVSFILGILLSLCSVAQAQQFASSVQQYGPENGLSHREVNAIFQDRRGFMWFGTKFGLNRFDGLKFTTYTKDRNGLDFDEIQSIAQDADGLLWLMGDYTESKTPITLFNPLTGTAVSFEKKFKKHPLTSSLITGQKLFGSPDGTIFFASYQPAILTSYHPKSGLRYVPLAHYKNLVIHHVTARNTVWAVADGNQLVELTADGRVLHTFRHDPGTIYVCLGQPHAGIEFFYTIYSSNTDLQGVQYSVDQLGNRRQLPTSLRQGRTAFFSPIYYAFDRSGLIWTGTRLLSPTTGTLLDLKEQLAGQSIDNRCFFADRNGWMWLGTSFGVYQVKVAENYFHRFFYEPTNIQVKTAAIRGISVVGDKLYANLEKTGLFSDNLSGESAKKQLMSNISYGLITSQPGKLLIGQLNLVTYDIRTGTHSQSPLPNGGSIWTFYPLSNQHFLAGGISGLWLVETKTGQVLPFSRYNQFPELAKSHVLYIGTDRQSTVWICSTAGLYTVDPSKGIVARYWSGGKGRFRLPTDNYQHVYQDPQGLYWLATANAGLIRWDRQQNSYRQFRRTEGLSNDNIYAVYADRRGHLWLSSDYGIMQFDPVRMTTRSYTVQDGITHNEFNRIAHFQDQSGHLYFGGLNGITSFDPQDFEREKPQPTIPLRIVSFRQFDNSLDKLVDKTEELIKSNRIILHPGDRTSVLDFALLNYADAPKNVYAYQFTGLDNEWTYQTEPSLRLGNLPYGEYQLLVKGQAADGQMSSANLAIQVIVQRPFYLRSWFLLLMLFLLIGLVWGWGQWRAWRYQQEQTRLQTQIKAATELIAQQAQDLRRLDETKSRFFANISHEFRTPLTVILGMAASLNQKIDPELRQMASLIERNGSNLLRLINQILDLSKLEAGEMPLHLERADLVSFVRYVGESFHTIAQAKGVQLQFQSSDTYCEADFNKDKLQDIVANLLANALRFTPTGGQVIYSVAVQDNWHPLTAAGYHEELSPSSHLDQPWIQITVSDTGPGIEPASLSRIFDRFYQQSDGSVGPRSAENPPSTSGGSTGIGLSLVRELVGLMQGGLAVRNRPGLDRPRMDVPGQEGPGQPWLTDSGKALSSGGAEFVVRFPLTRRAPLAKEEAPALAPINPAQTEWIVPSPEVASERPVVLLVEDNDDVATYIQICLRDEYQVVRAENGQVGIDQALATIPDLVLSDVMMPIKDGFALCDTLKQDERTSHIPIVLLTARAAVSDRIAGLRRGADAYLVKPFSHDELLVVLSNLLQSRHRLQRYYGQLALGVAEPIPDEAPEPGEDQFLFRLRSHVLPQLDNPALDIDMICALMGTSRTALHRKMTALTGLSMNRYLRTLRLQKAKELLLLPDLNIAQIADAVGFQDPSYFGRVFAEEFGLSPSHYRDVNKK